MIRLKAVFLFLLALATPAGAATCEKLRFDETPFTVCTVDPAAEELRLFLRDKEGRVLGSFSRVKQALEAEGLTIDRLALDPTPGITDRYLGEATSAVYLTRPDQHVAARWPSYDEAAVTAALKRAIGKE